MKGKRPSAPRCPACGRYMEVYKAANSVVVYECCGIEKTRPSPSVTVEMHAF